MTPMPSDSLTILYRSGYYIGLALVVASFSGYAPIWVPIACLVSAFILHNLKRTTIKEEAQDQLYDRYAPDLKTRDDPAVWLNILDRIKKLKAADPAMAGAFGERLQELNAHFGRNTPTPIMHALLRDFEFAAKYLKIAHPDAIERGRVLIDRIADINLWLQLTGTPPTQEEMDTASRQMLRNIDSKLQDENSKNIELSGSTKIATPLSLK